MLKQPTFTFHICQSSQRSPSIYVMCFPPQIAVQKILKHSKFNETVATITLLLISLSLSHSLHSWKKPPTRITASNARLTRFCLRLWYLSRRSLLRPRAGSPLAALRSRATPSPLRRSGWPGCPSRGGSSTPKRQALLGPSGAA
jgi:hypothetical protein